MMKAITTTATVAANGTLTVTVPTDMPPGEHEVVLVIDEEPAVKRERLPLKFSAYPVGVASESFTFRREDLYDDNGQ